MNKDKLEKIISECIKRAEFDTECFELSKYRQGYSRDKVFNKNITVTQILNLLKQGVEKTEIKGVKLYRAMYERGDRYINCFVSNDSEERAEIEENPRCVIGILNTSNGAEVFFCGWDKEGFQESWNYVVPINSKGEILTQEEVEL